MTNLIDATNTSIISNNPIIINIDNYNLLIGKFSFSPAYISNLYIGEIMYWNRLLSLSELHKITSYLFIKWSSFRNIQPTLTLNGNNTIYLTPGSTYIDLGVSYNNLLNTKLIPNIISITDLNNNQLLSIPLNALTINKLPNSIIYTSYSINYNLLLNSLYLNSSNQYLSNLFNPNNSTQWTISFWLYNLSNNQSSIMSSINACKFIYIDNGILNTTLLLNSNGLQSQLLSTKMPMLDTWTHIVLKYDSTQSDKTSRYLCYYNNILQTNTTEYFVELNQVLYEFANPTIFWIGNHPDLNSQYNGYLSQFLFIDNQALTPDNFGYLVNNTWIAKIYTGTFGNNGWYLNFSNSLNSGLDISGNNNNWIVNNIISTNIIIDNICPQIYLQNSNIIINNGDIIILNQYTITYTVPDNNENILSISRHVEITTMLPPVAYYFRKQYMYTINPMIVSNINLLDTSESWTIEFYLNLIDNTDIDIVFSGQNSIFQIICNTKGKLLIYSSNSKLIRPLINFYLNMNQWYHIAIQKNDNNIEIICDGSLIISSLFNFNNIININKLIIGSQLDFFQTGNFNISQFRINNVRRYEPPFKPCTNLYIDKLHNCIFALGYNFDDLITKTLLSYNNEPTINSFNL